MREITRSVKVALKCLIAVVLVDVDLPYWTSKVEHSVTFMAIFSNICTAHAQKRIFINFRCKFWHRRSICRPRFPIRVQNFSDLATFSVDFCILYAKYTPYFYFRFVLTYRPTKYTTRVDPHVDNSHQVWSWYDHQLPSNSVYVCRYVTWPVTLTFDLLTLNSCHTWRVLWPTLPPSIKTRWLPLKMRTRPLRMRRITWPVSRGGGEKRLHFWNHRPRFASLLYNFCCDTTTINGRLLSERHQC